MVPPDDIRQFITEHLEEIRIGSQDRAVRKELDDRLRARQCIDLALAVQRIGLGGGDVGRDLYHLVGLLAAEDRIVGCFDPDRTVVLAETLVLLPFVRAFPKPLPEGLVGGGACLERIHEQAVVLANDFGALVSHGPAEIFIHIENVAVEIVFDNRKGSGQGIENMTGIRGKAEWKGRHDRNPQSSNNITFMPDTI